MQTVYTILYFMLYIVEVNHQKYIRPHDSVYLSDQAVDQSACNLAASVTSTGKRYLLRTQCLTAWPKCHHQAVNLVVLSDITTDDKISSLSVTTRQTQKHRMSVDDLYNRMQFRELIIG